MEKDIKFCDPSIVNLILIQFKRLKFLKYRDKLEQAKDILTLVIPQQKIQPEWNLPVKSVNDPSVFFDKCILFSIC